MEKSSSSSAPQNTDHLYAETNAVPLRSLLKKMMPEQAVLMEKFRDIVRSWHTVAGPVLAGHSAPYDLKAGVLYVAASSPHSVQQITLMKGNIRRIIRSKWDIEISDISASVGAPAPAPVKSSARRCPAIEVDEADVDRLRDQLPDSLTSDTADAVAHFRAFFEKRFGHQHPDKQSHKNDR